MEEYEEVAKEREKFRTTSLRMNPRLRSFAKEGGEGKSCNDHSVRKGDSEVDRKVLEEEEESVGLLQRNRLARKGSCLASELRKNRV